MKEQLILTEDKIERMRKVMGEYATEHFIEFLRVDETYPSPVERETKELTLTYHETCHYIIGSVYASTIHIDGVPLSDVKKWNTNCDKVTNKAADKAYVTKSPKAFMTLSEEKFANMTAEEIYEDLEKTAEVTSKSENLKKEAEKQGFDLIQAKPVKSSVEDCTGNLVLNNVDWFKIAQDIIF